MKTVKCYSPKIVVTGLQSCSGLTDGLAGDGLEYFDHHSSRSIIGFLAAVRPKLNYLLYHGRHLYLLTVACDRNVWFHGRHLDHPARKGI